MSRLILVYLSMLSLVHMGIHPSCIQCLTQWIAFGWRVPVALGSPASEPRVRVLSLLMRDLVPVFVLLGTGRNDELSFLRISL